MVTRFIESPRDRDMLVRFLEGQKLPLVVTVERGSRRTAAQNRLQRQWVREIAEQLGDTPEHWRGYCKLHFGVGILKAEDEAFAREYDAVIKPLPYEAKLRLMQEPFDFGVTRRMTAKQKKAYLDAIHRHFSEQGVALTDPDMAGMEAA